MSAVHSDVLWASCSPSRRTDRTSWGAGPPASAPAQWALGRPREPSEWGRSSPSTWARTAALLPAGTWERGLTLWKPRRLCDDWHHLQMHSRFVWSAVLTNEDACSLFRTHWWWDRFYWIYTTWQEQFGQPILLCLADMLIADGWINLENVLTDLPQRRWAVTGFWMERQKPPSLLPKGEI